MNKKNETNDSFNDMLSRAAARIGSSPEELKKTAESNPKLSAVLKNLSRDDINKINEIINDKEASAKILATPQAQEILKMLKTSKKKP